MSSFGPPSPPSFQTTTKLPAPSVATAGATGSLGWPPGMRIWVPPLFSASNWRATMRFPLESSNHVTTTRPSLVSATSDSSCRPDVVVLTTVMPVLGAPAASKRRMKMPSLSPLPWPSQLTTKSPELFIATLAFYWSPAVLPSLILMSPVCETPALLKMRA